MSTASHQPGSWTPAARVRLARLPDRQKLARFARHFLKSTRSSACRAFVDGGFVAVTLRSRGVRPLIASTAAHLAQDVERARRVSEAVDAGLGMIPMAQTCLRRSVTLLRELQRLGLSSTLHIGVRHGGGQIEAHAWVQVGSAVVNDDPLETTTYTELASGELERILPLLG